MTDEIIQTRDYKFALTGILFPLFTIATLVLIYYLLKPSNPELEPLLPR
jgi:hypothetical protein